MSKQRTESEIYSSEITPPKDRRQLGSACSSGLSSGSLTAKVSCELVKERDFFPFPSLSLSFGKKGRKSGSNVTGS